MSDPMAEDLEFEAAIGRNVRHLRQQHGLTVADMAARVGAAGGRIGVVGLGGQRGNAAQQKREAVLERDDIGDAQNQPAARP